MTTNCRCVKFIDYWEVCTPVSEAKPSESEEKGSWIEWALYTHGGRYDWVNNKCACSGPINRIWRR